MYSGSQRARELIGARAKPARAEGTVSYIDWRGREIGRGVTVIDQKIAGATTPIRARPPLTSPRGLEGGRERRPRAATGLRGRRDDPRRGRRRRRYGRPLGTTLSRRRACAPRARALAAGPPSLDDLRPRGRPRAASASGDDRSAAQHYRNIRRELSANYPEWAR